MIDFLSFKIFHQIFKYLFPISMRHYGFGNFRQWELVPEICAWPCIVLLSMQSFLFDACFFSIKLHWALPDVIKLKWKIVWDLPDLFCHLVKLLGRVCPPGFWHFFHSHLSSSIVYYFILWSCSPLLWLAITEVKNGSKQHKTKIGFNSAHAPLVVWLIFVKMVVFDSETGVPDCRPHRKVGYSYFLWYGTPKFMKIVGYKTFWSQSRSQSQS